MSLHNVTPHHLIVVAALVIFGAGLAACDTTPAPVVPDDLFEETGDMEERLDTTASGKPTGGAAAAKADGPAVRVVAFLRPPTVRGDRVAASDIAIREDRVYVGYIKAGEPIYGGLDVLDADEPDEPGRARGFVSESFEVGAVARSGRTLFLGGAYNPDDNTLALHTPAAVVRTDADLADPAVADLASSAATDVEVVDDGTLLVTTGAAGGQVYVLDGKLKVKDVQPLTDPRAVVAAGGTAFVLTGSGALWRFALRGNRLRDGEVLAEVGGLRPATIAKMTYHASRDELLVPLNDRGLAVVEQARATGAPAQVRYLGHELTGYVSQAVAAGRYYFAASVERGVTVLTRRNGGFEVVQVINLEDFQSNVIAADDDYLYVAAGEGGTYILALEDD